MLKFFITSTGFINYFLLATVKYKNYFGIQLLINIVATLSIHRVTILNCIYVL